MPSGALIRIRIRKARKASTLACGCYVRTGHLIARVDGRWVCFEHLPAARSSPENRDILDMPTGRHVRSE